MLKYLGTVGYSLKKYYLVFELKHIWRTDRFSSFLVIFVFVDVMFGDNVIIFCIILQFAKCV